MSTRAGLVIAGMLCVAEAACVSTSELVPPPGAIRIGTVLPFSGARAASGVALETAMRLAVDQVNEGGGLGGRRLWLDVRDSHSDDARGTEQALALINGGDSGALPFFIGTEEPSITSHISSAIKAHQMVHVMPGLTSPRFHDPSASAAWFRLSPSGAFLACALAKHMLKVGVTRASPVVDPDDYSNNFATMFGSLFSSKGGTLLPTVQMDPRSASHADTFSNLARLSPDAIALVTSPSAAAGFLQEWAVRNKPVDVYLGPTLNSPELLRNVPLGILEGISGVSADLGSQSSTFESFLLARTKVPSIAGSHYYFDSVALLALAVAEGIAQTGVLPPPSAMMAHMLSLTSPGGTLVGFDQLAQGLGLLAAGQKIEYQGAAGAYVLNALGDSTYNRGAIWQIKGTAFESIDYEQCEVSELQNGSYPGTEF